MSETAGAPQFLMVKQNSAGSSRYPIIVRDLRTWSTAEGTRLVLDLNRTASFTETHLKNPDRVVIDITNAILGKSSRQRVSGGTIPQSFHITQSRPRVVTITLARTQGTKYKAFSLDNPDRLVIDIYQKAKDQIRQIGDTASTSPSAPSVALPTPPAIPSPTVTEPVRPTAPKPASPIQTIVIDPGHGGKDPGTIGQHGTTEKDVTLKVGLLLKDLLSTLPNTRVLMTRERDAFIELEDRAKFANGKDADLFVSIHVNSHPHKGVRGLEIYHFGEAKDQRALEVAARENGTPLNNTGVGWEYLVADLLTTKKIEHSLELAWTCQAGDGHQSQWPVQHHRSWREDRAVLCPSLYHHAQHSRGNCLHVESCRGRANALAALPGAYRGIDLRRGQNISPHQSSPMTAAFLVG